MVVLAPAAAAAASVADESSGAGESRGNWAALNVLSAWLGRLTMLRPSSSVVWVSAILGGVEEEPMLWMDLDAVDEVLFICCMSYVIFSVFMASRMFVVAVGSRASTVKVQSSWFCSKRRRRLEEDCLSA